MKWTEERKKTVYERSSEALREFGLLWLVFSLLDKLVAGQLTIPWSMFNAVFAVAVIAAGTYVEVRIKHAE